MKKLLSILLSVLMVLIMTSVGVFAESPDGITLRVETKTAQVGINHCCRCKNYFKSCCKA